VNQNIEDLGLDRDHGAARAQFTALTVERKILKQKQHVVAPATHSATISQVPLDRNQSRLKTNQCLRKDCERGRRQAENMSAELLSGPERKLFQRLLRIISALRAWCTKPARVKPLRINRFH
jgi:hypothetical protein